jgi:hypothetical protein
MTMDNQKNLLLLTYTSSYKRDPRSRPQICCPFLAWPAHDFFSSSATGAAHLDDKKKSYLSPQECEGKDAMKVPLTRSTFALPVVCGLRVTGTLDLCGGTLRVPIDHPIELEHQGRLCKWQVNSSTLDGAPAVTHAAIRFNIISPF